MSVRSAELIMGVLMLLASFGIMSNIWFSDLTIGWIEGRGPGAGMWPFWLAVGMALSSLWTLLRWYQGTTPESRNEDPYIDPETTFMVLITIFAIFMLLAMTAVIGLYFSMIAFLIFYIRFIGRASWKITAAVTIALPIGIYMLFEVALNKYLPRGLPFFENIILVIDDFRYSLM